MRILTLAIITSLLLACNEPKDSLYAGASSMDINPPIGSFIAGDQNNRQFTGIHDSIFVKTLVVAGATDTVAIVTLDCIGLLFPEAQKIRERAVALTRGAIRSDQIMVASNHIHSGPDVVGIWGPNQLESGVDPEYIEKLVNQSASSIALALKSLQPAEMHYAVSEFGKEWVQNISIPDEFDRSLTVLQFSTLEGNSIATLTNFACHPTFYDAVHDQVSADYVGAFYQQMSQRLSGEHLFLQGAIGGWVQPDKGDQSFAIGQQRGTELSAAVLTSLETPKQIASIEVDHRNRPFDLPITNPVWSQLSQLGVINRQIKETVASEIMWIRIGSAEIISHPGETPPAYSFQSKSLMSGTPNLIAGLGMDAMGYILKPEFFDSTQQIPHSEYLTRMSPGAEAGTVLMNEIRQILNE